MEEGEELLAAKIRQPMDREIAQDEAMAEVLQKTEKQEGIG